ncbi:MAG: alpha/beta hydrolase [Clostridia bacterium]|nr:alpha/beta hydrolase [Clostridia bacterium]
MASKNGTVWPLNCALKLKIMRHATTLVSPIIQTDKKAPNVQTMIDIAYSHNKKDGWQRMDWHFPIANTKDKDIKPAPTIFYYHGGGWASADKSLYSKFCKDLAERGFCVVNINYRLMPEYEMEVAINDCIKATNFALNKAEVLGIDKNNVFFAGDSAGAHISALIAGQMNHNITELNCTLKGLILYYGVYDFFNLKDNPMKLLHTYHEMFTSTKKKKVQEFYYNFSPTTYVDEKYPPCFMTSGEYDKLHPESENFARILKNNNVEVKTVFFEKERKDARHAFLNLNTQAAQEAFLELIDFLNKHID